MDIIFVHGITGDHKESWTHTGTDKSTYYWPAQLEPKGVAARVYSLQYASSYTGKAATPELNIFELGKAVAEAITIEGLGTRPLAFVGHSMGGIVIKEALRSASESSEAEKKSIVANTRLVCFIATPHKGSTVAAVLNAFAGSILSPAMATLSNDSGYLTALNASYKNLASDNAIATVAYYEKHKTNGVLLVSEQDADPGVSGCETMAIGADHISIARPSSDASLVFRSVARHLGKVVKACEPAATASTATEPPSTDYSSASAEERRDLLQKLIDAGREHEYPHANALQSRFAVRFTRLGLHTESRQLHDDLLAMVEQRFIMHVFHEKICKYATDDEIAKAIQTDVIDPVAVKFQTSKSITAAVVLEAIYYLTQQCHLRWDKS